MRSDRHFYDVPIHPCLDVRSSYRAALPLLHLFSFKFDHTLALFQQIVLCEWRSVDRIVVCRGVDGGGCKSKEDVSLSANIGHPMSDERHSPGLYDSCEVRWREMSRFCGEQCFEICIFAFLCHLTMLRPPATGSHLTVRVVLGWMRIHMVIGR